MKSITPPRPRIASADLFVDPPAEISPTQIEVSCRVVADAPVGRRIWFRFPRGAAEFLTRRADPFVLATLLYWTGRVERVRVHGTVSAGLLANLADFQLAFPSVRRRPRRAAVEFLPAETAREPEGVGARDGITAFSGGVDSCFSLLRHSRLGGDAAQRPVSAALLMQGFDIPLTDTNAFARATARCRELADEAGVLLFAGQTNLRTLPVAWEDSFATAVAAALTLFQPAFAYGLIPSFQDWRRLDFSCGSNPLTDPLLSSLAFQIVHDGTAHGRIEKLRELTKWPAALRQLRVCWQGAERDRNCCRCEKCLRTMLMLRLCGESQPAAFPLGLDVEQLARLKITTQSGADEFAYLLAEAGRLGLTEPWVPAARRALRRSRHRLRLARLGRAAVQRLPERWRETLTIWRAASDPIPAGAATEQAPVS